MKFTFWAILLLIPSAVADTGDGKNWRGMTEALRVGYVSGYMDAVFHMSTAATPLSAQERGDGKLDEKKAADRNFARGVRKMSGEYFPSNLTVGDVMDGLNRFYDEPANRNIPIPWAIEILAMKVNGKPEDDINNSIRLAREINAH